MAQPSDAYRQHHDVAAPRIDAKSFRQGWRIVTRLDVLFDEGAIDGATYEAGAAFGRDWEVGLNQRSPLMSFGRRGGAPGSGAIDRLKVLARLRRIAAALGPFDTRLLQECIILDQPWTVTGREHGVADTTARRWTIAALGRLAKLRP
jgi:hypothetical protein